MGGNVAVTSSKALSTSGANAAGIFAQSVGGGGGNGGAAVSAILGLGASKTVAVSVAAGGNAAFGSANVGGSVSVTSSGLIKTVGDGSVGIRAELIGGGGGTAAMADSISLFLGVQCASSNAILQGPATTSDLWNAQLSLGGSGGTGDDGGSVSVTNTGAIGTRGAEASGVRRFRSAAAAARLAMASRTPCPRPRGRTAASARRWSTPRARSTGGMAARRAR